MQADSRGPNRVAALVAAAAVVNTLSGLYCSVAVLTDSTYREEFLGELTDDLRSVRRAPAAGDSRGLEE